MFHTSYRSHLSALRCGSASRRCVDCLTFDKFNGKFDTRIRGFGLDVMVSEVQNTTLKDPKVGKNIPTVAKWTQGEVRSASRHASVTERMS
jgi:hypothetical protein